MVAARGSFGSGAARVGALKKGLAGVAGGLGDFLACPSGQAGAPVRRGCALNNEDFAEYHFFVAIV